MKTHKRRTTTLSPVRLIALSMLFLSGCASHKLGPQATYVSAADQKAPPLAVTAAFRPDMCTRQVAYLSINIENPSAQWKKLTDVQLDYPYDSDKFYPIRGKKLLAWADAREQQAARDSYNAGMARLAAFTVGRVMMESHDKGTADSGKALAAGSLASDAVSSIRSAHRHAEQPPGGESNHLFSDELLIAPGTGRTFWILLGAEPNAPLMGWTGIRYTDENNLSHQLVATIGQTQTCDWQEDRIQFLGKWMQTHDTGIRTAVRSQNPAMSPSIRRTINWIQVEKIYQDQSAATAAQ